MSLTLTYREIYDPGFSAALKKLADCSEIKNVSTLLRLVKVNKTLLATVKECTEIHQKLLDQYGARQENNTYKIINVDEYNAAFEQLMKTELEVEGDPFKFNDLLPAKPSATDLTALGILVSL